MSNRERDALLGNDAERARRKAAMDGVERSSVNEERLVQTARTAQESAETGENILSKLHDQREKIDDPKGKVRDPRETRTIVWKSRLSESGVGGK